MLRCLARWIVAAQVTAASAVDLTGLATVYTRESCQREGTSGTHTANGNRYVEAGYTCAMRSRAFGRYYLVTSQKTGRQVIVCHTDYGPGRGPAKRGVIIDLTPAAMKALGLKSGGRVTVTPWVPPDDHIRRELVAREIAWRRACMAYELRKMEASAR